MVSSHSAAPTRTIRRWNLQHSRLVPSTCLPGLVPSGEGYCKSYPVVKAPSSDAMDTSCPPKSKSFASLSKKAAAPAQMSKGTASPQASKGRTHTPDDNGASSLPPVVDVEMPMWLPHLLRVRRNMADFAAPRTPTITLPGAIPAQITATVILPPPPIKASLESATCAIQAGG